MITLNVYVYAVLLQLLILLVLLSAFAFYRVHQLKKTIAQKPGDAHAQTPDASQYLATETKLTRGRYEATTALRDGDTLVSEQSLLYALRADFLDIEHTLADEAERNDAFWAQVEQRLRGLLETHHLSIRPADPPPSEHALPEDTPDTQTALSSQVALIERLKTQVAQEVKDEDTRNLLNAELDALAHSNRELSDCVSMLEEANTFLHNQLRTLADT